MYFTACSMIMSLVVLLAACQHDSGIKPPEAVSSSFSTSYPHVEKVIWESEGSLFEATFLENTVENSVTFSADGTIVNIEKDIAVTRLPAAIPAYVENQLSGKTITASTMTSYPDGTFAYEVEVEGKDYVFDAEGKFLREKPVEK